MAEQTFEQVGTQVFTRTINVPPAQVYYAFTNATALREWMCDVATLLPREGGRLYMAWNSGYYACGEFTALEKDRYVAFTWHGRGEPHKTHVRVTLAEMDGSSQVEVEHSGTGTGEEWAATIQELKKGWEIGLDNLKSVLETGEDLRLSRRPMLGITLSDFSPEIALKQGVPVTEGIRLDSTLEGMGAHAAGLQSGDVIVSMGGQPVQGFNDIAAILQGRYAGEKIEVVFYRGSEKRVVEMVLSSRPLPEIPKTAQELAKIVEEKYEQIDKELKNIFQGVTEEEASFKAGPGEWSAKEILAHLILSERFSSNFIVDTVAGQERWSDDYPPNNHEQTAAVVVAYPTVNDLLEELRRNERETIYMLKHLPESFMQRKGSYWHLAYSLIQPDYHAEQHYEQIRAAIESARRN